MFLYKSEAYTKQEAAQNGWKPAQFSVSPQWHNPVTSGSVQTWAVTEGTKQVPVINTIKCITSTLLTLRVLLLWAGKHRETLKCQKRWYPSYTYISDFDYLIIAFSYMNSF